MTDRAAGSHSIVLIAALSRNRVIGRDNELPWRLPRDLQRFKSLTMGKAILMGRRTFESIGRALPGRDNFVVTRSRGYEAPGCQVFGDIDSAIEAAGNRELMVIGGAQIYAQTLARAQRLYLTWVETEIEGDALFPAIDTAQWQVLSEEAHPADDRHAVAYRFIDYQRQPGAARNPHAGAPAEQRST